MIKQTLKIALLSLGLVSGVLPWSSNAQNLTEQLGKDPKVTTGVLPNGMKYYIRPNQKPENKVELRLIINAGSILEDDDQLGLAHFTEHMLFNGTKNFPKNKLVDYLQSIGVEFGADLNAYTSFDETVYMLPIPTDKPGNVETGFQILQDWAQGALFTDKDINEERNIILEEARARKSAQDRMQKKFLPKLFGDSKYAKRLPIGDEKLIATFKPDVIRRYYRDWYRPDLMAVVVVGDITTEKAEQLVKQYFTPLKNPATPRKREYVGAVPYKNQDAMFLTDPEQSSSVLLMNFSPVVEHADKTVGDYRESLVERLALSALNQRFSDLSSSAKPPFAFAQVSNESMVRGYKALGAVIVPGNDMKTSINAAVAEILSVQAFGFTNSELELVKKDMLSGMEKSYNERNTTNSSAYLGEYQRSFLDDEAFPGIEKEFELYKQLLPGITAEEVTAQFKKLLKPEDLDNYFAVVMSPENTKDAVNSDATLLAAINNAFKQTAVKKEEKVISENLLDKEPVSGTITATSKDDKLGTTNFTLSNGIKVTLKTTDFKSDEVLIQGMKKGGTGNYGEKDKVVTGLMPLIIGTMGYGKYTPTDLEKALSGKNVDVSAAMDDMENIVSGSSDVKSLETFFQLAHLQLTEPRLDEDLLKGFLGTIKSQLMFAKSNPKAAFQDSMNTVFYNNNPLKPIIIPSNAELDGIDAKRAIEIYKKEFASADGYQFFIVGNVDEKTLRPLLEKYIASLPKSGVQPASKDNGLRPIGGTNKFVLEKGKEKQSTIVAKYYGEMPFSEDMSLKATLLGDILTIRVIEKIREEMGAIYSGGFSGMLLKNPYPNYTLQTQLTAGPENVDKVLTALDAEIAELKKNGPQAKDLEKVKIALVEKRKENLKTNRYWLAKLAQFNFENYSVDRFLNFDSELNKITVKDIKEAANKFFNDKNKFVAVLNPEAQK